MSKDLAADLAGSGPLEVLASLVGLLAFDGGCEDDQCEDEDDAGLHFYRAEKNSRSSVG